MLIQYLVNNYENVKQEFNIYGIPNLLLTIDYYVYLKLPLAVQITELNVKYQNSTYVAHY